MDYFDLVVLTVSLKPLLRVFGGIKASAQGVFGLIFKSEKCEGPVSPSINIALHTAAVALCKKDSSVATAAQETADSSKKPVNSPHKWQIVPCCCTL